MIGRSLFCRENCTFDGTTSKFLGHGQARNFCNLLTPNAWWELVDVEMPFDRQWPLGPQDNSGGTDHFVGILRASTEVN